MDEDDLADWQLCWKANLLFYEPVRRPEICINCSKEQKYITGTRRSMFWRDATRCSVGHRQVIEGEICEDTESVHSVGALDSLPAQYLTLSNLPITWNFNAIDIPGASLSCNFDTASDVTNRSTGSHDSFADCLPNFWFEEDHEDLKHLDQTGPPDVDLHDQEVAVKSHSDRIETARARSKPGLGVCASCDQMYMFDVIRGKHTCRRDGCRRKVRVNEGALREKVISNQPLLNDFIQLLRRYRVFECVIHCDDVAYENNHLAFKGPTSQCNHDRNVCNPCLQAAYESAVRGGRHHDLICLDPECKKPIPMNVLRSNISTEVFKIYNKQLALKTISKDENFRWCQCGHGQIHTPGASSPEWFCLSCSTRHCFICKSSSNPTLCTHLLAIDRIKTRTLQAKKSAALQVLSAAQHRMREDEAGTQREIARTTKKCPKKGCCNKIERDKGCGHFTCPMCRTEFCWCCKAIWKEGRAVHIVGCRIGTRSQVQKGKLDLSEYAVGWDKDEGYDLKLDTGLWLIDGHM